MEHPNTSPDTIDAEFDSQPPPEQVDTRDPPPELVDAVVRHYVDMRTSLESRVATIEAILGFIREDGDTRALAVRVAKLEAFLGVKG